MKKSLLTGLGLILPLFITIWILSLIFRIFLAPFIRLSHYFILQFESSYPHLSSGNIKALLYTLSPLIALLLLLVFVTLFGMLMRLYLFDAIGKLFQKILDKMPLVGKTYRFLKDTMTALFGSKEKIFEDGVLVQFPMEDKFGIGLKLKEIPEHFVKKSNQNLKAVLILTAPHPIAGYLLYYPEEKLKTLDTSVENVMKFSVSLGTIFK